MSDTIDGTIERLGKSIMVSKVLKPLVEAFLVFVWIIYLAEVLTGQDYNGNLTFDLFLARVGGPTASHATTYLIFLSIFPIAYLMLRSVIPAFLVEALAFDIHEGLWQVAYYIAWHSVIDWRVWVTENALDTVTTVVTIVALLIIYRFPARFFLNRDRGVDLLPLGVAVGRVPCIGPLEAPRLPDSAVCVQHHAVGEPDRVPELAILRVRAPDLPAVLQRGLL